MRWGWVRRAAHRLATRGGPTTEVADLVTDLAVAVVEARGAGVEERRAYGLAEHRVWETVVRDRAGGLTGDTRMTRRLRVGGTVPVAVRSRGSAAEQPGWRLAPGQWRALRAFVGRHCTPIQARVLRGLLCEGQSLGVLADSLGLTLAAVAVHRSHALRRCYRALGRT